MDFYNREPWGFDVEDVRAARRDLIVAKAMGGAKQAKLEDFLLRPREPEERSEDDLMAMLKRDLGG